jgi:tetratricopeptide (TPR) repeat protein
MDDATPSKESPWPRMNPDLAAAIARHQAGDLAGAEAGYLAILAVSEDADALCNLGLIAKARGRLAEAEDYLVRATRLAPDAPLPAYNLGSLYWRAGRLAEALAPLELAAAHLDMTDARLNLGNVYLALGRDAEGWPLYDERPERLNSRTRKLSFPEWQGQSLEGKRLLIWPEQGFGDQILAARFVPHLAAAHTTFVCQQPLVRLFGGLGATVVPSVGDISVASHDYWILPMSLARWAAPIESAPYLAGRPSRTGGIGVAWQGNALPDPGRSLPSELAAELLSLPGAISLHPQDSGARDFQDTADIIAGLDLVISIDTSVAHLAGAMGKPTLVLLQHHGVDWRWRANPPWYPSVETLRQPAPGDWRGLVEAVTRRVRGG